MPTISASGDGLDEYCLHAADEPHATIRIHIADGADPDAVRRLLLQTVAWLDDPPKC